MHELFRKPHGAALAFIVAGMFWFVIGTLYGLLDAIHLAAPEVFNNISWLVFGRIRPIHVNTVLFGFVTSVLIGCGLYYTPFLLRRPLWSEPMAWISFLLWSATIVSGPITFSMGMSQGREYAEYLWPFDVTLTLAMLLILVNLIMTILRRTEETLYVSVWYFVGTFLWTLGSYPIGNVMWRPETGAMPGLLDSIFLWFWGHNLPGLLLTPLAVGAAYFVVPRVARVPLYSHVLSLIGFWTLVLFYSHIGGHHILQAPIPTWLKAVSVVDSVAMVIPVFTAIANIWITARGRGHLLMKDQGARFIVFGLIWYLITCIQGPIQSIPFIQRVTHFTNWTVGHAHIAVLGFSGFIALGAMWHVLPLITGRKLYSERLVSLQFGLVLFGITGFFLILTTAGLIQGQHWYNGETVYRVLPEMIPYMMTRAAVGLSIILAAIVGLYNVVMSIVVRPEHPLEVPLSEGAP